MLLAEMPFQTCVNATVVVDAATGMPLPRAMVADRYGNSVGVCSDSGIIPSVAAVSYPLTVRYMGYQAVSSESR